MKRQNLMKVFAFVAIEVGTVNDSKSDLRANSDMTLSWGNVIPLNANWVSVLNNGLIWGVSAAWKVRLNIPALGGAHFLSLFGFKN